MITVRPPAPPVRCHFVARYPAGGGRWRYERIYMDAWDSSGNLPLDHPPQPGDLIVLSAREDIEGGPVFTVIARMWVPAVYGSMAWPGGPLPSGGPTCELIVEPAEGLYADEAPAPDDD